MKPVSSFSSSSSSSVYENQSCSNGRTCISRILRRILCFSSRPLCSFNRLKEDEKESSVSIGAPDTTPGIVARLMGLESLPRVEPIEESPPMSSADSIKKSRSSTQVRRRVAIPAYQELEDDNFFILSFEKGGGRHQSHIGRRKSMKDNCKKKSMEKNKENEEVNMVLTGNLGCEIRDDFQLENSENVLSPLKNPCQKSEKTRTKKAKAANSMATAISFEIEGDSENSSPNSVLEFVEFPTDQDSAFSGEISRLANSKMRRPLTLIGELDNNGNSREKKSIGNGNYEREENSSKAKNRHQNYAEIWDEIGNLAAMKMMKSSWVYEEKSKYQHCFMEISRDLGSSILDQLLDELLIDLENY